MKECKYSKYCGGCSSLEIDYDLQLENKSKLVQNCFEKFNIKYTVPKTIGTHFPYKYRNKVHLAFKKFKGKTIIGFFEEGSGKVVDIETCLLHDKWLDFLIKLLKNFVQKFKIEPYDPISKTGTIRYVAARVVDNNIMLTLVTTTRNFAGREFLYAKLKENFKNVSLYINVNNRTDKLVFDEKGFSFVKGEKYLNSTLLGVKYSLAPNSFLQINLEICKAMYSKALDWLDIKANDLILDLYSGIGITSILFAKKCSRVVSIEYNSEATKMANINKIANNMDNLEIKTGPCEKVLANMDLSSFNKIFLDPARLGAERQTIDKILQFDNINKIVYMSCDPETLARDLKLLTKKFDITYLQTYDMFPQTKHVETLVCLQRKSI